MPRSGAALGSLDTVAASAARTSSGSSAVTDGWGATATLRAQSDVTAVSGTVPTLDVVLEDTLDGVNYNTIGTFAQKVAAGREVINITSTFTNRIRARWTIGGTSPSFTFSIIVYSE